MPNSARRRRAAAAEGLALFRRREQRAQSGEAVRGRRAERDQLGERFLDLGAQQAGAVDDLVVERRAVLPQIARRPSARARSTSTGVRPATRRDAMSTAAACAAAAARPAWCGSDRRAASPPARRRRQARPDGAAGQAQVVEPRDVVVVERAGSISLPTPRPAPRSPAAGDHRGERVGALRAARSARRAASGTGSA